MVIFILSVNYGFSFQISAHPSRVWGSSQLQ